VAADPLIGNAFFMMLLQLPLTASLYQQKTKKKNTKSEGKKETLKEKTNGEKIMKLA